MPQKRPWTPALDAQLRRLRAEGATWDGIAALMAISRNAAIERGRRIGARRTPPEFRPPPEDPNRPPLPPGHPRSWQILIAGSCLEGQPYPLPVF